MRAYYSTPACCNPLFPRITCQFSAVSAAVGGPLGTPSTQGAPDSHTAITQSRSSCLFLSRPFSSLTASRDDPRSQALKRDLQRHHPLRTATVKVAAGRG